MSPSIFLEFNLPNSATWFYFSWFLAVALFFHFGRVFTLRNWDLLALFLFAPGFLLIQEANQLAAVAPPTPPGGENEALERADRERLVGYAWLLGASAYWFVRCLLDLATVKRPLVSPNLSTAALVWFGAALFLCLTAVAVTRPADPWGAVGKRPVALTGIESGTAAVVSRAPDWGGAPPEVRFAVERTVALACHGLVVAALLLIGAKRFNDLPTGVSAAALYLLLPYTAFQVGQAHHVWPAALLLWAVYLFRWPFAAGAVLGLAAGTVFFPVLLLPAWLQFYRGRGAGRLAVGFVAAGAVSLGLTLAVLAYFGEFPASAVRTLNLTDWQPWRRPTAESLWTGVHWAYRLPVFVVYAGFVLTTRLWPPVRNLGQLVAVSAAVVIGVQFWFADRGGLYVLWYSPLLVLVVLRPNLADLQPGPPGPPPRFVGRVGRWAWGFVRPPRPEPAIAA